MFHNDTNATPKANANMILKTLADPQNRKISPEACRRLLRSLKEYLRNGVPIEELNFFDDITPITETDGKIKLIKEWESELNPS